MICGDCIHKEVCGLEGHFDDALITCTHKTELSHNTGHWIERRNRATGHIESICSECEAEEGYPYNDYCGNCGAKMFEPQESEE